MKQLKRKIIQYYIMGILLAAVLEVLLNGLFEQEILPALEKESILFGIAMVLEFVLSIGLLVFLAVVYCKLVGKKIDEETSSQLEERNLLYSNIIHDLKTPMTSILGFASALKDNKVEEEEKEQVVRIIYEKAKHTDELVNQLFRFTKLQNAGYALNLVEHNICALVRDIVAQSYMEFENREMELVAEIPEQPVLLPIDVLEMRRAVQNLVVNAYRHNKKGTRIWIGIRQYGKQVKIIIADSGSALERTQRESIFQPFVCGNESRSSKDGSGLGLAITKSIIEKHGGKLTIEEFGKEYTKAFVITL